MNTSREERGVHTGGFDPCHLDGAISCASFCSAALSIFDPYMGQSGFVMRPNAKGSQMGSSSYHGIEACMIVILGDDEHPLAS